MHVGIVNPRWRGKCSWHSRRMRNPQFYVSGKRPMLKLYGQISRCATSSCMILFISCMFHATDIFSLISIHCHGHPLSPNSLRLGFIVCRTCNASVTCVKKFCSIAIYRPINHAWISVLGFSCLFNVAQQLWWRTVYIIYPSCYIISISQQRVRGTLPFFPSNYLFSDCLHPTECVIRTLIFFKGSVSQSERL